LPKFKSESKVAIDFVGYLGLMEGNPKGELYVARATLCAKPDLSPPCQAIAGESISEEDG